MKPGVENMLLAAAFLVYFACAFIWPSVRVWRMTGRNPYVLPASDDVYGFVTKGMRVVILSLLGYLIIQAAWPASGSALGSLDWLSAPIARWVGWTGLALALIWTVVAQYQMGLSWRIGIDMQQATPLVTTGLFGCSRNPIFLAMRVGLWSLVLIRPNVVTVALWLIGDVLMQFQVRLEEAYLGRRHGSIYAMYRARVRRWI